MIEGITKDEFVRWSAQRRWGRRSCDLFLLVIRTYVRHHVGVHVRDEEIHPAIVVVGKELYAHCSPRRLGKVLLRPFDKSLAPNIFEVVVRALHI